MIQKHILLATFRVVAFIKGECVELPRFPRVCFFNSFVGGGILNGESVISDVLWCG
jgi:hypothetical protein